MARSIVMLATCAAAAALPSVALYDGGGVAGVSEGNYSIALTQLVSAGVIASFTVLNESQVASQLQSGGFSMILFPGGSGSREGGALGPAGEQAVRAFVQGGGGYMGTCAGGYLAGNLSCCDVVTPGYCGGGAGCVADAWGLQLLDQGVAEPWDRGWGEVTFMFNDDAMTTLQLPSKYRGVNVSVLYWQGPILDRNYPQAGITPLATFTSEIHSGHSQYTTGQMVGTPALWMGKVGAGRVLISSPHPEQTTPMLLDIITQYVLWTSGAI